MRVADRERVLSPLERPTWLPESVWPFETGALRVRDRAVAVTDVGTGPTLLFVHVGLWSFVWRDLVTELAGDFRCVCLDAPGNGRSQWPATSPTLDVAACAVRDVIEELRLDDLTLLVHDLGGVAGIAGAARASAHVVGIAALNAFAWRPAHAALRAMLRLVGSAAVRRLDAWTGLVPRVSATTFGAGRHMDRASRAAFIAGIGRRGIDALHRYMADALRAVSVYTETEAALRGRFASLPLLTVFGEHNDPFGFQAEWRRRYPSAAEMVVRSGNHFPMCDDPPLVAHTIRSWRSGQPRAGRVGNL